MVRPFRKIICKNENPKLASPAVIMGKLNRFGQSFQDVFPPLQLYNK